MSDLARFRPARSSPSRTSCRACGPSPPHLERHLACGTQGCTESPSAHETPPWDRGTGGGSVDRCPAPMCVRSGGTLTQRLRPKGPRRRHPSPTMSAAHGQTHPAPPAAQRRRLVEMGPTLLEIGTTVAEFSQHQPPQAKPTARLGAQSTGIGDTWGRAWPNLAKLGRTRDEFGRARLRTTCSAIFCASADFANMWPAPDRLRPKSGRLRPNSPRFGRIPGQSCPERVCSEADRWSFKSRGWPHGKSVLPTPVVPHVSGGAVVTACGSHLCCVRPRCRSPTSTCRSIRRDLGNVRTINRRNSARIRPFSSKVEYLMNELARTSEAPA